MNPACVEAERSTRNAAGNEIDRDAILSWKFHTRSAIEQSATTIGITKSRPAKSA
jgi:hypothetical protein